MRLSIRFFLLLPLVLIVSVSTAKGAAEPKVQIVSPKEGTHVIQQQNSILISGKVANQAVRSENVDIMFIIDISGSTSQYAGWTSEITASCLTVRSRADLAGPKSASAALG